jgi:hypothetical protein
MNFQFFLDKIMMPLLMGAALFLAGQFTSSFVTSAELYQHKMENAQSFAELNGKMDFVIKSQVQSEKSIDRILQRLDSEQKESK